MYRLLSLFAFLFGFAMNTNAQIKVFDYKVGWKGKWLEMSTMSNAERTESCTILIGQDSILAWYFPGAQMAKPITAGWSKVKGETMAGGFIRNGEVYFFLENEEQTSLRAMRFNPTTKLTDEHNISFDWKKEKLIDKISNNNRLLYFTFNRKQSVFKVYDFNSDSSYNEIVFKPTSDVWESMKFGRTNETKFVNTDFDPGAEVTSVQNKIYARGDSILLIVDPMPGHTRIFDFDLTKKTIEQTAVFHETFSDLHETPRVRHNSIMHENNLYYACVSDDSLAIECYSFPQGELLSSHRYSSKNEIDFKSTDILLEHGVSGKSPSSSKELNSTRRLINKIMHADLFLSVETDYSGRHLLSVGSIDIMPISSPGRMGGGFGVGALGSIGSVPMTMSVSLGGFSRGTYFKTAYFRTIVDPITTRLVPGSVKESTISMVELYSKQWKEAVATENIFKKGKTLYYGFYDRDSRKIVFIQL